MVSLLVTVHLQKQLVRRSVRKAKVTTRQMNRIHTFGTLVLWVKRFLSVDFSSFPLSPKTKSEKHSGVENLSDEAASGKATHIILQGAITPRLSQQKFDYFSMSVFASTHQSCRTLIILDIDICTTGQQSFNHIYSPMTHSKHQSSLTSL